MKLNNQKGFTLVEILTGAAVAVVAFAALSGSLGSAYKLAQNNINNLHAVNAISDELQALRVMNYSTLTAMASPSSFTNSELAQLPTGATGTVYVQSSFGADISKITVVVSWNSNGTTATQRASTYLTRRGINGS